MVAFYSSRPLTSHIPLLTPPSHPHSPRAGSAFFPAWPIVIVIVTARYTSKGVRVAACLECVLDSYARRAQAGGVTVSQQKHLICPASQRLPAAVIVQPAPIATRPILLHSLPNRISPFPSLHQLVAHLVRCPLLSLQIPFAARRLQPALAFPQSCYHQPHHQLLPTHHQDWPASSRARILQPRRHFFAWRC